MTKPITPAEVGAAKVVAIPAPVFEAFNAEITKHFSGGSATVMQKDVVTRIKKLTAISAEKIFENGWMDVEAAYEEAGWEVTYDKPGFNESYEPTFKFRAALRRGVGP